MSVINMVLIKVFGMWGDGVNGGIIEDFSFGRYVISNLWLWI